MTLAWAHKGILLPVGEAQRAKSRSGSAYVKVQQPSVCGCSLSSLPGQSVGRWGRTPGKALTAKPSPHEGSKEDLVLLEPWEVAVSSWS